MRTRKTLQELTDKNRQNFYFCSSDKRLNVFFLFVVFFSSPPGVSLTEL